MLELMPVILLIAAGMLLSVRLQKLTLAGAAAGGAIGLLIYAGAGYMGIVLLSLFFIMGTAATAWHRSEKEKAGMSQKDESRRRAGQVIANAGVAAMAALAAWVLPQHADLFHLMLAAAFSSATADTLSSELGNVYGSAFYNIRTFQRDRKGLDGVISWEGTLAGLAGSMVVAAVYALMQEGQSKWFFIIIIAGTLGNLSDSFLGAVWERKGRLSNNAVNFLNTFIAAMFAAFLFYLL